MLYGTTRDAEKGLIDAVRAILPVINRDDLRKIVDAMMSLEETVKSEIADEIE